MENNITSLEEIIKNANSRLTEKGFYSGKSVKSLKEVAQDKGIVLTDPNFESGINIFEQSLLDYSIDKKIQLMGIFTDDEKQIIRKQYFSSQTELAQIVNKKDSMQVLTPNLQKMLSSDLLISSISDYGLCYDFSKIKELLLENKFEEAENIASRDWFVMRTLNYFFKAKKVATSVAMQTTKENTINMNKVIAKILNQKDYKSKEFPRDLKVTFKNLREKKIVYVDRDINQDLGKIENACENKQTRTF